MARTIFLPMLIAAAGALPYPAAASLDPACRKLCDQVRDLASREGPSSGRELMLILEGRELCKLGDSQSIEDLIRSSLLATNPSGGPDALVDGGFLELLRKKYGEKSDSELPVRAGEALNDSLKGPVADPLTTSFLKLMGADPAGTRPAPVAVTKTKTTKDSDPCVSDDPSLTPLALSACLTAYLSKASIDIEELAKLTARLLDAIENKVGGPMTEQLHRLVFPLLSMSLAVMRASPQETPADFPRLRAQLDRVLKKNIREKADLSWSLALMEVCRDFKKPPLWADELLRRVRESPALAGQSPDGVGPSGHAPTRTETLKERAAQTPPLPEPATVPKPSPEVPASPIFASPASSPLSTVPLHATPTPTAPRDRTVATAESPSKAQETMPLVERPSFTGTDRPPTIDREEPVPDRPTKSESTSPVSTEVRRSVAGREAALISTPVASLPKEPPPPAEAPAIPPEIRRSYSALPHPGGESSVTTFSLPTRPRSAASESEGGDEEIPKKRRSLDESARPSYAAGPRLAKKEAREREMRETLTKISALLDKKGAARGPSALPRLMEELVRKRGFSSLVKLGLNASDDRLGEAFLRALLRLPRNRGKTPVRLKYVARSPDSKLGKIQGSLQLDPRKSLIAPLKWLFGKDVLPYVEFIVIP